MFNTLIQLSLLPDMESKFGDEIGVKISPSLVEPPMLVTLASGNRSQNFIDEVFRGNLLVFCSIACLRLCILFLVFYVAKLYMVC